MDTDYSWMTGEMRDIILESIRKTVGNAQYRKLLKELGEDQLIGLYWGSFQQHAKNPPKEMWNPRDTGLAVVLGIILIPINTGVNVWMILAVPANIAVWISSIGPLNFILLLVGGFVAGFVVALLRNLMVLTGTSWAVKAAAVLAAIGAAGVAVWFAGPWVWNGVVQWWGWLGAHLNL
jgi:hypothetical protein